MKFVDTSAWFACQVAKEAHHPAAIAWLKSNGHDLLTTDYLVDETLTLLRSRGHGRLALRFGKMVFEEGWALIHHVDEADIRMAWQLFRDYSDKEWSFTDYTSKVVMDRLGIQEAFTFDHHSRQFGVMVVPGT